MTNKKKTFIICLMTAMTLQASAQDVIVQRDGTTILSKVLKVGTTEVEYKKWDNQDGPSYAVAKTDLLFINYQNGTKDDFSKLAADTQANNANEQGQREVTVHYDQGLNKQIIEACNTDDVVFSNEKEKEDKQAKIFWCSFNANEDSKFVNDEIELRFEMCPVLWDKKKNTYEKTTIHYGALQRAVIISIKNKTNKTIFIDLGNTFFIRGEESYPYYVPSATSTTQGGSTGASVNLGSVAGAFGVGGTIGSLASGVNVGGSKSSASTTVTYSQRIISIPPMSTKQLDMQRLFLDNNTNTYVRINNNYWKNLYFDVDCNRGETMTFTNETSPVKFGTYLTYSIEEDFSTYSHLSTKFYMNKIIGGRNQLDYWQLKTKDFTGNLFKEYSNSYTKGLYLIANYMDM